jgi:hypothetical protein
MRIYILRCWPEMGESGAVEWRFMLETVPTGLPRHGFTSLEALATFLDQRLAEWSEQKRPYS